MHTLTPPAPTVRLDDAPLETRPARQSSLDAIASGARADRNRAIDCYRAIAMLAVALGHWLAADVRLKPGGGLDGGNALDQLGSLHMLTWVFQVMPLFFCIGGFSNAASLDGHWRKGGTSADWVRARLRRLVAPSAALAGVWFAILAVTQIIGLGQNIAVMAAGVAAIPLWFLANYVADTALAPITLRLFRSHRNAFLAGLAIVFLSLEATRFFNVRYLLQANIVIGWLCFQVLGFAWRDGLLPSARRLMSFGAVFFVAAIALVAFGPWPIAMVSVPGAQFANTWPPSLALLVFGFGYCCFAIAASQRVSDKLERSAGLWKSVVLANTITMTSYLWHFTALIVAAGVCMPLGLLPTASIGSGAWFAQKLLLIAIATVVLVGIIAAFGRYERAGLLGGKRADGRGVLHAGFLAVLLGAGFEVWTAAHGHVALLLIGSGAVVATKVALDH